MIMQIAIKAVYFTNNVTKQTAICHSVHSGLTKISYANDFFNNTYQHAFLSVIKEVLKTHLRDCDESKMTRSHVSFHVTQPCIIATVRKLEKIYKSLIDKLDDHEITDITRDVISESVFKCNSYSVGTNDDLTVDIIQLMWGMKMTWINFRGMEVFTESTPDTAKMFKQAKSSVSKPHTLVKYAGF